MSPTSKLPANVPVAADNVPENVPVAADSAPENVPVAADSAPENVPPPLTVNVVPSQVNLSFSENFPFDPK